AEPMARTGPFLQKIPVAHHLLPRPRPIFTTGVQLLKTLGTFGLSLATVLLIASGASAATITVNAGGNLQGAIDAAQPSDTILLAPNATFDGPIKLGKKTGTADITIRSAAPDSSLPSAGQRIDPSYSALLPKIRATSAGPAMRTESGTAHYVLMFLEFLPA